MPKYCSYALRAFSLLLLLAWASPTYAGDPQVAKDYIAEAQQEFDSKDYEGTLAKLDLAEAELEGLGASEKAPLQKSIDQLKQQVTDSSSSLDKQKYTRQLERAMDQAEGAIGNLVTWKGAENEAQELFDNPAAKKALGADLAKAQTKFAAFKKLHLKKAGTQIAAQVAEQMKSFQESWAEKQTQLNDKETSPNTKGSLIAEVLRDVQQIKARIDTLPDDDAAKKKYLAQVEKVAEELGALGGAAEADEFTARFQRSLESYENEWSGWEQETVGATWDEFQKTSSETISRLNAPKSSALASRLSTLLKELESDDGYRTVAAAKPVKSLIDKVKKDHDAAQTKLVKFATSIVEQAEKGPNDERAADSYGRLQDAVRVTLGEAPQSQALQDRVAALIKKQQDTVANADAGKQGAYQKLTQEAAAAWPAMLAKFSPQEGFDPTKPGSFKGKTIKITTDNLMGYRFKPGDFPFATTLNGHPVAARYSSEVAGAIETVEKKIGRALGDNDDDGQWTIIATVDGSTGKMLARRQESGDLLLDGRKVGTYEGEYPEPVTAPIITIVAAHCGPLAVAKGQGMATESGKVTAAPAGKTTVRSGGGFISRIIGLLLGLTAAFVCLHKAKFSPLVNIPQVSKLESQVGAFTLPLLGLALSVLFLFYFLISLWHFSLWGMLVNLVVAAAAFYAGMELLALLRYVKPKLAKKLRPVGIPLGLACAILVILSVVL